MLFSSVPFLFYFLPCVLILYFLVPRQLKNGVLLLASLVFYGWGEPRYLVLMLVSVAQGYVFGRLIERHAERARLKRLWLTLSVVLSLGMLGYFKYADFFIANFNAVTGMSLPLLRIALPIGISFYTFQILSYVIDVYRGDVPAQHNVIDLAAYIAMFPQLIAGPIVRYADVAEQLRSRKHSIGKAALGLRRFTAGLAKKILIANVLGELVSVFKGSAEQSVLFTWLYAAAYVFQIYFDFSGYSDMAIGLGKILGFDFCENFDHPLISGSATEFWRRWHMSLGSWFRDYLYIPLGGNRVGRARWFLNIFIVWFATGFWHGAAWNFILWGLFFAVLLVVEKLWLLRPLQKRKWLGHIYMVIVLAVSFVLFDAESISAAAKTVAAMFGGGHLPFTSAETLYYLRSYLPLLIVAAVGATPLPKRTFEALQKKRGGAAVLTIAEPVGILLLLVVCTAYLIDGSFNPFLYFRF